MINFRSRKAFTVAVEGNIGSGKTTFLNRFCPETDNVDVLAEPVDRDAFAMMTKNYNKDEIVQQYVFQRFRVCLHHELLP